MSPRRTPPPSYVDAQWTTPPPNTSFARNGSDRAAVHRVSRWRVWQTEGGRIFTEWEAPCGTHGTEPGRPPSPADPTRLRAAMSAAFTVVGSPRSSNLCRFGCWPARK